MRININSIYYNMMCTSINMLKTHVCTLNEDKYTSASKEFQISSTVQSRNHAILISQLDPWEAKSYLLD